MQKKHFIVTSLLLLATPTLSSCSFKPAGAVKIEINVNTNLSLTDENFISTYGSGSYSSSEHKYTLNIDTVKDTYVYISKTGYNTETIFISTKEMVESVVKKEVTFGTALNSKITCTISNIKSFKEITLKDEGGNVVPTINSGNTFSFYTSSRDSSKTYKYTFKVDDYLENTFTISGQDIATGTFSLKVAVLKENEFSVNFINYPNTSVSIYNRGTNQLTKTIDFTGYSQYQPISQLAILEKSEDYLYVVHESYNYNSGRCYLLKDKNNPTINLCDPYEINYNNGYYLQITDSFSQYSTTYSALILLDPETGKMYKDSFQSKANYLPKDMTKKLDLVIRYYDYQTPTNSYYLLQDVMKYLKMSHSTYSLDLSDTSEAKKALKSIELKTHTYHPLKRDLDLGIKTVSGEGYFRLNTGGEYLPYQLTDNVLTLDQLGVSDTTNTIQVAIYDETGKEKIIDYYDKLNESGALASNTTYSLNSCSVMDVNAKYHSFNLPLIPECFTYENGLFKYVDNVKSNHMFPNIFVYKDSDGNFQTIDYSNLNIKDSKNETPSSISHLYSHRYYLLKENEKYSYTYYNDLGKSITGNFTLSKENLQKGLIELNQGASSIPEQVLFSLPKSNSNYLATLSYVNVNNSKILTSNIDNDNNKMNFYSFSTVEDDDRLRFDINFSIFYNNELINGAFQQSYGLETIQTLANIKKGKLSNLYLLDGWYIQTPFENFPYFGTNILSSAYVFILDPSFYNSEDVLNQKFTIEQRIAPYGTKEVCLKDFQLDSTQGQFLYVYK